MSRARLALGLILVWACGSATAAVAQTTAPPEGWVVLPVDEYRTLRDRANPPPPPPAIPPVDATLTRLDYDLRADGDAVTGRALLTLDVLRDGWTRVAIPAGLRVRDAQLDGQPVSLVDGPSPHVLLSRAGRFVLSLDLVVAVATSAGSEAIVLPPSNAPISRTSLVLPRSGVDVTVTGGFVADHTEDANESRWTAYGRPTQPLTLTWKRKIDDRRAEQPLRIRARVAELAGLGEEMCLITAAVRIEVLQGLVREIVLAIPAGVVVDQVNGPTVADWDTRTDGLRVRLLEPAATATSFVVQAEMRVPRDGSVGVPLIRVPAAERESGGIGVDVAGAGEIAERLARGLEPADPSELAEVTSGRESPSMIAFRFRPLAGSEARSLTVGVVRYTPQAVLVANVEEARYRTLASDDGRLLVDARYAIRNNQRSFLKVTLPEGATVWSAEVAGRPMRPGAAGDAAVLLPLEKGRAGEEAPTFVLEIVYLQRTTAWTDKGRTHLDLPSLDLPVSRTGVELHYSPRFRVELQPGEFRAAADPGPFAEALRHPPVPVMSKTSAAQAVPGGLQALADRFRADTGGRTVAGVLPVHVTFPDFGPSMFVTSELTPEDHAPCIELALKRVGK